MNEVINFISEFLNNHYEMKMVRKENCYDIHDGFIKITPVESSSSIIVEYAENMNDVENNLYEDSGLYPISLGKERILELIKEEILQ